jgi:hypothetical protein
MGIAVSQVLNRPIGDPELNIEPGTITVRDRTVFL